MEQENYKSIYKFRKDIEDVKDLHLLNNCLELLRDMIKINDMKEKISNLEETFLTKEKAMFYFLANNLTSQEVVFAAEKVSGMIKVLEKNDEKK